MTTPTARLEPTVIAEEHDAVLTVKRFDLMQQVNIRGTFLLTSSALPHLVEAADARVIRSVIER